MNTMIVVNGKPRRWTKMDLMTALFGYCADQRVLVQQGDSQRWMYINGIEREDGSGSSFNVSMTSPDGTNYIIYIRTID